MMRKRRTEDFPSAIFFDHRCEGLLNFLEVKDGQVHLAFRDDVDGENGFTGTKVKFCECRGDVPMMPLTPGYGIG
jgi:hypothetical protein